MANKGIIVFDRNIDVEKTQENGRKRAWKTKIQIIQM